MGWSRCSGWPETSSSLVPTCSCSGGRHVCVCWQQPSRRDFHVLHYCLIVFTEDAEVHSAYMQALPRVQETQSLKGWDQIHKYLCFFCMDTGDILCMYQRIWLNWAPIAISQEYTSYWLFHFCFYFMLHFFCIPPDFWNGLPNKIPALKFASCVMFMGDNDHIPWKNKDLYV